MFGDEHTGDSKVSAAIRRQVMRSGMTGKQLAERTGLSKSTISRVLSGRRTPSMSTAIAIANALDIDPAELLEGYRR